MALKKLYHKKNGLKKQLRKKIKNAHGGHPLWSYLCGSLSHGATHNESFSTRALNRQNNFISGNIIFKNKFFMYDILNIFDM